MKLADGKWDLEEYRNGAVGWCRYVTGISEIDAAYELLLSVNRTSGPISKESSIYIKVCFSRQFQSNDSERTISFDRYKELVVEFFTSEDSNTPARHIFGPLELKNIDLALTTSSKQ